MLPSGAKRDFIWSVPTPTARQRVTAYDTQQEQASVSLGTNEQSDDNSLATIMHGYDVSGTDFFCGQLYDDSATAFVNSYDDFRQKMFEMNEQQCATTSKRKHCEVGASDSDDEEDIEPLKSKIEKHEETIADQKETIAGQVRIIKKYEQIITGQIHNNEFSTHNTNNAVPHSVDELCPSFGSSSSTATIANPGTSTQVETLKQPKEKPPKARRANVRTAKSKISDKNEPYLIIGRNMNVLDDLLNEDEIDELQEKLFQKVKGKKVDGQQDTHVIEVTRNGISVRELVVPWFVENILYSKQDTINKIYICAALIKRFFEIKNKDEFHLYGVCSYFEIMFYVKGMAKLINSLDKNDPNERGIRKMLTNAMDFVGTWKSRLKDGTNKLAEYVFMAISVREKQDLVALGGYFGHDRSSKNILEYLNKACKPLSDWLDKNDKTAEITNVQIAEIPNVQIQVWAAMVAENVAYLVVKNEKNREKYAQKRAAKKSEEKTNAKEIARKWLF